MDKLTLYLLILIVVLLFLLCSTFLTNLDNHRKISFLNMKADLLDQQISKLEKEKISDGE
jgi:hypothetical protein